MSFSYFGQIIVGPAGSGKSTYCKTIQDMGELLNRNIFIVNLDPAAEELSYRCDFDVRDLVSLDDVVDELKLGPNGGLLYCMEYLLEKFDFLHEQLMGLGTDDYVLFDCPGQIELYVHLDVMSQIVKKLQNIGFSLCSVYLVDCLMLSDESKFTAGILMAMSTMLNIALPHLTILSKCDLIQDKKLLKKYCKNAFESTDKNGEEIEELDFDFSSTHEMKILGIDSNVESQKQAQEGEQILKKMSPLQLKYRKLNLAIKQIVSQHSMVDLIRLDLNDNETVRKIVYMADNLIQYGENLEPNEKFFQEGVDNDNNDNYNKD